MSLPKDQPRRIPTLGVVGGNVICDTGLSTSARLVYAALCLWRDRETDTCYPSNTTLSATLGVSQRTVIRALEELSARGWIERRERFVEGRQTTSLTYVRDLIPRNPDKAG